VIDVPTQGKRSGTDVRNCDIGTNHETESETECETETIVGKPTVKLVYLP